MKKMNRMKILKWLLFPALLIFVLAYGGCGSSSDSKKEDADSTMDDVEESVTQEEIDEIMSEELTPLEGDELAMMEDPEGEIFSEDDEMRPLDESDLEQPEDELIPDDIEEDDGDKTGTDGTSVYEKIKEDGTYTGKIDVAVYIHTYGKLPSNYITEEEAEKLGWVSSEDNLDEVAPGKSIGGDEFKNENKMLPEEDGRTYQECDIDYEGGARGSKRIVFSNDGLIFYSEDNYETFEQLY
ncbi:MAG: ribonuclease domain-containing protein [Blautia sp.]|nr:ribonuclease [Blautia sp.]MDY3999871.1 ribonuclease domain-containing protein [Blautia sp.]